MDLICFFLVWILDYGSHMGVWVWLLDFGFWICVVWLTVYGYLEEFLGVVDALRVVPDDPDQARLSPTVLLLAPHRAQWAFKGNSTGNSIEMSVRKMALYRAVLNEYYENKSVRSA